MPLSFDAVPAEDFKLKLAKGAAFANAPPTIMPPARLAFVQCGEYQSDTPLADAVEKGLASKVTLALSDDTHASTIKRFDETNEFVRNRPSGSHHSGAPGGCDLHFLYTKSAE